MKNTIITINRESGSGGHSVGQELAKRLDVPFYDGEMMKLLAKRLGMSPEYVDYQAEHRAPLISATEPFALPEAVLPDEVWRFLCELIPELANKGPCVIVGRCANYILRDRPDVVRAFLHAPLEFKVNRVLYDEQYRYLENKDIAKMNDGERRHYLTHQLTKRDRARAKAYEFHTGHKWANVENYDICVNTARWGIEGTVQLLQACYESRSVER